MHDRGPMFVSRAISPEDSITSGLQAGRHGRSRSPPAQIQIVMEDPASDQSAASRSAPPWTAASSRCAVAEMLRRDVEWTEGLLRGVALLTAGSPRGMA